MESFFEQLKLDEGEIKDANDKLQIEGVTLEQLLQHKITDAELCDIGLKAETRRAIFDRLEDIAAEQDLKQNPMDVYEAKEALLAAAEKGEAVQARRAVAALIAVGADLEARNSGIGGVTALYLAAENGHLNIVRLLVDKGSHVNVAMRRFGTFDENRTPLQKAAENGHLEIVRLLADRGAHMNSALFLAAKNGHLDIIRMLVDKGIDVNTETENGGQTALFAAVSSKHLEVVRLLLNKGAYVNAAFTHRFGSVFSPLQIASEQGNLEMVRLLVDKGADVNTENVGRTAIHIASDKGNLEIVHLLVDKGADVNSLDRGRTALHIASEQGNLEIVRLLVEKGADVNAATTDGVPLGITALHIASKKGNLEIVLLLLEKEANVNAALMNSLQQPESDSVFSGVTALHLASSIGRLDVVRALVDKRADVNATNRMGKSALFVAAQGGYLEIVRLLVDKEANVNVATMEGGIHAGFLNPVLWDDKILFERLSDFELLDRTLREKGCDFNILAANGDRDGGVALLFLPVLWGNLNMLQLLLEKGADVNVLDCTGNTALIFALQLKQFDIVRLLVEYGANVDAAASAALDGCTALMLAAIAGHPESVRLLIDKGADVNAAVDINGQEGTALIAASNRGHLEVARLLVENGAKVNADWNLNALYCASEQGHLGVVSMLIDKGADVNASTAAQAGETAFAVALSNRHLKVVRLLAEKGADINTSAGSAPALYIAAMEGHLELGKALLNRAADVEAPNVQSPSGCASCAARRHGWTHSGWTALMVATENGSAELVRLLVDKGADVKVAAADGATALCLAAQKGDADVVRLLVGKGADVDAAPNRGRWSPLFWAVHGGHAPAASALLDARADAAALSAAGDTPLTLAVGLERWQCAELLLSRGGAELLPKRDALGWTALHHALAGLPSAVTADPDPAAAAWIEAASTADAPLRAAAEAEVAAAAGAGGALERFGGERGAVCFGADGLAVFRGEASVRAECFCQAGAKGYYEIEVLDDGPWEPRWGFCRDDWGEQATFVGVGGGYNSWGVDGEGLLKWQYGQSEPFGCGWRKGDVVGLACDLNWPGQSSGQGGEDGGDLARRILVSVNGDFSPPNGAAFDLPEYVTGLHPALSCRAAALRCNLGSDASRPFRHAPPAEDYRTLSRFSLAHVLALEFARSRDVAHSLTRALAHSRTRSLAHSRSRHSRSRALAHSRSRHSRSRALAYSRTRALAHSRSRALAHQRALALSRSRALAHQRTRSLTLSHALAPSLACSRARTPHSSPRLPPTLTPIS